uniref:Fibronectin type-III domain-containing protein n=1 Tax=Amphimedon queenslandica TaxID=400682 RepID=A0A1X7TLU1_AMPQE
MGLRLTSFSGIVTLTIRGVSSVENIQYIFASAAQQASDYSLQVTWSPPVYYSNDIPGGSPVSYQVLVADEDGEILLDTNTNHTNITVANVTDCDTFNITVTALVDQYNASSNTGYEGLGYNATITTIQDNSRTPNVTIELSCPPSKSNTFLTITSGSKVIDQYKITGTDGVVNDTRTLTMSAEYNYTIQVLDLRNKLEYKNSTIINTYLVIDVCITNTYTNGSVSVQCIYEESSTADGCHVIFTHTTTGKNESFNITGPDIATLPLPRGNYTVTVYDINNGLLFGPALYYPTLVEVVKVTPAPISSSSSIMSKSTTPLQSTISNTVSPTATETLGTETTSSTNGTIDDTNYIVHVVAGVFGGIVLLILIILAVCVGITVNKRRFRRSIVFDVRESLPGSPLHVEPVA